jgi:two-component system, oxyanion-binding sensor
MSTDTSTFNSNSLEKRELTLGFIPLTDCAPLVVAREHGYFEKYGLQVSLSKETSWANIRDKVAIGVLDGAQMLAPMPIAMTLGLGPIHKPMVTALSMDLNGNAITVSSALYKSMCEHDSKAMSNRETTAIALRKVVDARSKKGDRPLTFAVVFPFSSHNYELRYWMAAVGIKPDRDVSIIVTPPSQMVEQLENGLIDGYCVGDPWNSLAVKKGLGHTLITKYEIWNNSPEKVFGVTQEWASQHPNTHHALLLALLEASRWVDEPANRAEVAAMIAPGVYVNAPESVVRMSMAGTYQYSPGTLSRALPDFNVFHRYAANFPWRSHASWFITQMVRWGQIDTMLDITATSEQVYRPDIYRRAAAQLGIQVPSVDYKAEGVHGARWSLPEGSSAIALGADLFLDGMVFDPANVVGYLENFPVHNMSLALDKLHEINPALSPDTLTGSACEETMR